MLTSTICLWVIFQKTLSYLVYTLFENHYSLYTLFLVKHFNKFSCVRLSFMLNTNSGKKLFSERVAKASLQLVAK